MAKRKEYVSSKSTAIVIGILFAGMVLFVIVMTQAEGIIGAKCTKKYKRVER